jgi:oligosaccharide 4-alpha-D-glucosyltransferase
MVAQGFPIDAIIFDLQWQGGVGEMGNLAWDYSRFSDPQAMMEDFLDKGVKSICIADPYFTQQCQFFGMLTGTGWFATEQDGTPYVIDDFWAGPAGLIDITDPLAMNWFWQRCKNLIDGGVTGLWTDLGEPERAPEDMFFEAGTSTDVRQTYNLQWAGGIYEGFMGAYPNKRLFNLTRSGYAGMQRYSTFPWSGDVQKTYGGMYAQIPIMLGMGLSGFGYMGNDIGGFVGDLNPELYTRWQQMGAFSPIMRAHGTGVVTEPIYFSEPYKSIVKKYIQLRYQLLPYNYTLAYINSTTGMPLARPLFFEDSDLLEVDDEYLWGNDLLVAPVMGEGEISRDVTFPKGKWIDFFDWVSYSGSSTHEIEAGLVKLPLFARAGAMIPMIPEIQHTEEYTGDSYVIRYFADPDVDQSQAMIYLDDGLTQQAVNQDEYSIIELEANYQNDQATIEFLRTGLGYENEPLQKQMIFEIPRVYVAPTSVYYNYVSIPITDNLEVYEFLEDVVYYNNQENPYKLLVKVLWNSTSNATLEINDLEIEPNFSIQENSQPDISIFPNPLTLESRVNVSLMFPGQYQFTLLNRLGQVVGQNSVSINYPGLKKWVFLKLFPEELSSGIYILKIKGSNGYSESTKLLVFD